MAQAKAEIFAALKKFWNDKELNLRSKSSLAPARAPELGFAVVGSGLLRRTVSFLVGILVPVRPSSNVFPSTQGKIIP